MSDSKPKNDSSTTKSQTNMEPKPNPEPMLEPESESNMESKCYSECIVEPTTETDGESKSVEPKPLSAQIKSDSNNKPSFEDLSKANAILSDIKADIQAKEIVINLDDILIQDAGAIKNVQNREFLVYEYFGQHIRQPKTTWVMTMQGNTLPEYSEPLGSDPESRNAFIRIVFLILLGMLVVTSVFVAVVKISDDLTDFFKSYGGMLAIGAMVVMIGLSYVIACSQCVRIFPCNIILLVLAVICMSIICAYITSRYIAEIVLLALVATCVVVGICFLLALSRFDFTSWMLYIVMISAALGITGLVLCVAMFAFGVYMKPLHIVILLVFSVINIVMLAMEIQMVLGGRTIELGEDDYALGAYMLYTSIVNIFLNCVQLLGISFEDLF